MTRNNPFEQISDSYKYAKGHDIDPKNPETWDDNYKRRMKKLAGILPKAKKYINDVNESLGKIK